MSALPYLSQAVAVRPIEQELLDTACFRCYPHDAFVHLLVNLRLPLVVAEQTALSSSGALLSAEHTALDTLPLADPVAFVVHHDNLEEDHKMRVHQEHKRTVLDRTLVEEETAVLVDTQVVQLEDVELAEHP
jgi:hypothetical protein